jgi:hypothetical protein
MCSHLSFFDDLLHIGFDLREVVLADRSRQIEVVVEPVAGRWSERQPHAIEQPHDRSGHDVSTRVSQHAEGLRIARRQQAEFDRAISCGHVFNRPHCVNDRPVDFGGNRRLCQPLANGHGDIESC